MPEVRDAEYKQKLQACYDAQLAHLQSQNITMEQMEEIVSEEAMEYMSKKIRSNQKSNDNNAAKVKKGKRNRNLFAIPRNAEGIPVAFDLLSALEWKWGILPDFKLVDDQFVIYRLDSNNQPIKNEHIIGYSKINNEIRSNPFLPVGCHIQSNINLSTPIKGKTSRKSKNSTVLTSEPADPMILYEVEYEEIEKSTCVAWAAIKDAIKGSEKDLKIHPISGWPIKVQNLKLHNSFIQKIRQNIEERKIDPLIEENTNKRMKTSTPISPHSIHNESAKKQKSVNSSSQNIGKRKLDYEAESVRKVVVTELMHLYNTSSSQEDATTEGESVNNIEDEEMEMHCNEEQKDSENKIMEE